MALDSGSAEFDLSDEDELNWSDEDELNFGNMEAGSSSAAFSSVGKQSPQYSSEKKEKLSVLKEMRFPEDECLIAMAIYPTAPVHELIDCILAARAEDHDYIDQKSVEMRHLKKKKTENGPSCSRIQSISEDSGFTSSDDENNESLQCSPEMKTKLSLLKEMHYSEDECLIAMERCGPTASIDEIIDCISAAQYAWDEDQYYIDQQPAKKKTVNGASCSRSQSMVADEDETVRFPNPMIGFGLPSSPVLTTRNLPPEAVGPPYFYYEQVARTPKGVWDEISRCLYNITPEFVDSAFFCAANRKRGYVHNLPIDSRFPILPAPPLTIQEALPMTKAWWPAWDERTKLNCLVTAYASAKLAERIREKLEEWNGVEPPPHVKRYVLEECRRWNLVWVGRNKVAPLDHDEVEMLMGFPKNHTRGGGCNNTDRYKSLGSSFQVDTVAYHLSVLKRLFPSGIKVLSLFSGIGGAEVALHRLDIPLKVVVSVEKLKVNRSIMQTWWEQTNQGGKLVHMEDVEKLTDSKLEGLVAEFGGFDLVIGGSPCTNLAGGNRHTRDGLEGTESRLFYEYARIIKTVRRIMERRLAANVVYLD